MKIFISLKVPRRNPELEQLADLMEQTLRASGHDPFLAPREIACRGLTRPADFMPFVRQQAETADLMIVLYHPELRGGLIELGLAFAHRIPIWLCYKSGQPVSSSALGCASIQLEYDDLQDLKTKLMAQLSKIK